MKSVCGLFEGKKGRKFALVFALLCFVCVFVLGFMKVSLASSVKFSLAVAFSLSLSCLDFCSLTCAQLKARTSHQRTRLKLARPSS